MKDSKLALLQTDAFKDILADLRKLHPVRTLLPENYTFEQRAIHQLRCEEYEKIMTMFETLGNDTTISAIQSTYGTEEIKQKDKL